MKKMSIFAVAVFGLCGALISGYADGSMSSSQDCGFSPEEQTFAAQLQEANMELFCSMTAPQRADCMKMAQTMDAYGNKMSPDQSVQSMAGGGCPSK